MKYKYKSDKVAEAPRPEPVTIPPGIPIHTTKLSNLVEIIQKLELQNQELRELYEVAPIAYLTIDPNTRIREINLTGVHMLGEDKEKLLHRSFLDYVAKKDRAAFILHHKQVYESGEKQTCELLLVRKSGHQFYGYLESLSVNSVNENGIFEPIKCRITINDITQRKLVEKALQESKQKNLAILNTIPDIIFVQDKNGVYIDYHAQCIENPAVSPKDFLGKRAAQVLPRVIAEPLNQRFKETLRTGQLQEYEYSLPQGNLLRYYETRMVRLEKDKVLSVLRDITRQKQMEKSMEQAHNKLERRIAERTEEAEEFNRQLKKEIRKRKRIEKKRAHAQRMETIGRIASGVAHEVRNPLNSIQAIIAVLNQELGDHREFQNCSAHINTQVERLSRLMRDLLELRPQDQKEFIKIESLPMLCRSAINLWRQSTKTPSHEVILEHEQDADNVSIMGDMGKLQQVFINLLDNAAQHSPEGSHITIEIPKPSKKNIRIHVTDRGVGIQSESLPHVFEPFFTRRHTGSGLGLTIVKNIIENHSGTVRIRNNDPLPGCTIEICLPLLEVKKE